MLANGRAVSRCGSAPWHWNVAGFAVVLPLNCRDVTAETIGTVSGIGGATAAKATKPG
jgi:hypothetical protein